MHDLATSKADRTNSVEDKAQAKRLRNTVTVLKKNMKMEYYLQAINKAGKDSAKLWNVIKTLS